VKKVRIFLIAVLFVLLAVPAMALTVGDIDFSLVPYRGELDKKTENDLTVLTHRYPDESIKIVQVLGNRQPPFGFHVRGVRYLKDGVLTVYMQEVPNGPYVLTAISDPKKIERITNELLGYIKKE